MSEWVHRFIIVPAAHVELARSLMAAIAEGASGKGELSCPLSPSGAAPATHWARNGLMWPKFADMLSDPQAIFEAAGGQVPLSTIQAMLSASMIREGADPHAVLAERGLKIVQEAA